MDSQTDKMGELTAIRDPKDFDKNSGGWIERQIFNHRVFVVLVCLLVTAVLGWQATQIKVNASFDRMIPFNHDYIQNYVEHRGELPGLGNTLRVVVETTEGDIYDPEYMETLRQINDVLFLIPGVDRSWMKSLWMPLVRWRQITETGVEGGPVMPEGFDGSAQSIQQLKANIEKSGIIGSLVAADGKSSMLVVPLQDTDPTTGQALDYGALGRQLEAEIRSFEDEKFRVHIVGFAKIAGDLIEGLKEVSLYFALSIFIASLFVYLYTRCLRTTLLLVTVSLIAVIWLLGLMQLGGYVLDPYSVLVPFLVFAIGLSHGAQKINGIMQDIGRGTHRYVAARYTFRRLFIAGLTALVTNVVGFAAMMIIDIPVIRDMALTMSMGVFVLIFTKLFLVPVLISYVGVSRSAVQHAMSVSLSQRETSGLQVRIREGLVALTERRNAIIAISVAGVMTLGGLYYRTGLQIGDLDEGAPELRQDSRYNQDNRYVTDSYGLSSDQFAVLVKTPAEGCRLYENLTLIDQLGWRLAQQPGVQMVQSMSGTARLATSGMFEGNPKWYTVSRDQNLSNYSVTAALASSPDAANLECSLTPVVAYLADHKADTLSRTLEAVESFAAEFDSEKIQFLPVAGSAGIEAVTNVVVERSIYLMHAVLYAAVILLCYIAFRSWAALAVAFIPLAITSILCEALMVWLGIGVKVATLPVIALGVGVGIDYALYLLSVQLARQRQGDTLAEAYRHSLQFTGKVVALVGVTMSAAVICWLFSPIKFQADMGLLLSFMFLWNMVGALVLIPALSHFLLPHIGREAAILRAETMKQGGSSQVAG